MSTDSQETLSLPDVMKNAVEQRLASINTAMPGTIVSYDPALNLAQVQPSFKVKFKGEDEAQTMPIISNVPVSMPKTSKSHLLLPLAAGDEGMLIFSQRSIDGWISSGGELDPVDHRKFALSDAVFYPGLHSQGNVPERKGEPTSIEIANEKGFIEIQPSGKFKVSNGENELLSLLVEIMGEIIDEMTEQGENDFTNTIFGAQQPVNFAKYTLLKTKYTALNTKLKTLKV